MHRKTNSYIIKHSVYFNFKLPEHILRPDYRGLELSTPKSMSCSQKFKFYAECGHSQCLISHRDFCPSEGAPPTLGSSSGEIQRLSPTWRFQTARRKTSIPQSQPTSSRENVGKTFQMLKQICDICAFDCQNQTEVWRSDFKWSKLSNDELEDRRKQWIELLTREKRVSEEKGKQTLADEESQERQRLWCKEFEIYKAKERKEGTPLVDQVQFYNPTHNSSEFLAIPSRERLRYLVVRPDRCSICREGLYIRADIRKLPCTHLFHSDCIRGQLSLDNTCPFCNHEYQIVRMPLFRQTGLCHLPMRRLWASLVPDPGRRLHQVFSEHE